MRKVRVTKEFQFDTAHALYNYDGLCRNIHGHTLKLWITVKGTPINDNNDPKNGMVIDFGELKNIVKENIVDILDHSCLLNSSHSKIEEVKKFESRFILFDFQPTSENLVIWMANKLKELIPDTVELVSVKLAETPTSIAEWTVEDNPVSE